MLKKNIEVLYISYDGIMDPLGQSQILPYLKGLAGLGDNISIISFEKKINLKEKERISHIQNSLTSLGIAWIPLRYHRAPWFLGSALNIIQGIMAGVSAMLAKEIKIIHSRGYISTCIALILKFIFRAKVIFDMRGLWPDEKVDGAAWRKGGTLYCIIKKIERLLILNSDAIVVLTSAAGSYLAQGYPRSEISVVPCCVDLDLFKPGHSEIFYDAVPRERFVLIYVGSLGTFYYFDKMLDFFKSLKSRKPESFLLVITNSDTRKIKSRIEQEAISENDYHVANLEYSQVPLAMSRARLSLMFYNRPLSGKFCFPAKFSESLACGLPVVINSGVGDCDAIISKRGVGVVVRGYSDTEYSRAITQLDSLFLEEDSLRLRCRKTAEDEFSLGSGIRSYRHIYLSLLKGSKKDLL